METIKDLCKKILSHEESRDLFLPHVDQANIQVKDWNIIDYEPSNLLLVTDQNGNMHQIEGEPTSKLHYITKDTLSKLYDLAVDGNKKAIESIHEILELSRKREHPTLKAVVKFGLDHYIPTRLPSNLNQQITDFQVKENKLVYKTEGRPVIQAIPLVEREISVEEKISFLDQLKTIQQASGRER
ncbi:hypothetical protein ABHN11_24415 [Brevibacillus centrosporus]|uniref:hypothetical protein n=1 Tax=Brevibacillus centrosporus TaxID=54910 RepID=UPI003D25D21C